MTREQIAERVRSRLTEWVLLAEVETEPTEQDDVDILASELQDLCDEFIVEIGEE